MNDNPQLDKILDEALSEYRDAEPLAGLEDRVLQRLRLQLDESPVRWWKWGMVAACATMLVFAAWLGLRSYPPHGPASREQAARQQAEARNLDTPSAAGPAAETPRALGMSQQAPLQHSAIQTQVVRSVGAQMQVSRLHDNGSDLPLTGEERQLLALAQTHPDALRSLSQQDQPIAITPLTIQLLPSEANENGDN